MGDILKTSMINEFVYEDFFRGLLDTGKDVIFLDMSQKMSVSFENAMRAAAVVREDYPDRKLYIMDTLCISGGLGLLVKNMVRRMEEGMSFDEVIAWGEENKLKIAHRFTVDDLNYLKAGGRVSNASALVGSILSIKPVLYVPDRGTLDVAKKVRGRRAALNTIRDGVLYDLSGIDCTRSTSCRPIAAPMPSGSKTRSARLSPRWERSPSQASASSSAPTADRAC